MENKYNKSAYNFLIVLLFIIAKQKFEINEIISFLSQNYNLFLFKESILKYIRTMKQLGFVIQKNNNKEYQLISFPKEFFINKKNQKNLLNSLAFFPFIDLYSKSYDKYLLLEKISVFIDDKNRKELFKKISQTQKYEKNKIKLLQQININCENNKQAILIFKNTNNKNLKQKIETIEIINNINDNYLKFFEIDTKKTQIVSIRNIQKIIELPTSKKYINKKSFVNIKLYSKLAQNYILKQGEELIKNEANSITIRIPYIEKTELFNKILKYMENCEIISPSKIKIEFLQYVDNLYQIHDCPFVN